MRKKRQRKQYSADLKAKIALEAVKGQRTVQEIASHYGIHPTMVTNWKKQVVEGAAEIFGRPIRDERREQRQRDLDARIADETPQPQHEPADYNAPDYFSDDNHRERRNGRTRGENPERDGGDREPIEDQRGGIIRKSLAFENDENAMGELQPPGDGEWRNDIRRRSR